MSVYVSEINYYNRYYAYAAYQAGEKANGAGYALDRIKKLKEELFFEN